MRIDNDNFNDVQFTKVDPSSYPTGVPITPKEAEPCCGGPPRPRSQKRPDLSLPFVKGEIIHRGRSVPRVSVHLARADHMGSIKARFGVSRMDYSIPPGLYGVGKPDEQSPVLVTANYKLTFDALRSRLENVDAWILVLDTMGINVWCAAGKGTFGTQELLSKIEECEIASLVDHRRIIVPQLGAPGVSGYKTKQQSGFKVLFGPVEARDLPEFLSNGYKARPAMREKRFPLRERIVLIPIELIAALKSILLLCLFYFVTAGLLGSGEIIHNLKTSGLFAVKALFGALVAGAVLFPLLLPYLPGRSFSVKSLPLGVLMSAWILVWHGADLSSVAGAMEAVGLLATVIALTAYLAMNFTGASTYTSLSGVQKEMRIALPAQIATASLGLILWIGSRIATYFG